MDYYIRNYKYVGFFLDMSKVYGTLIMKPIVKNGMEYLEIDDFSLKFIASKLNFKLDNLFNGDKALGKFILCSIFEWYSF
jgi:hypothetical protein